MAIMARGWPGSMASPCRLLHEASPPRSPWVAPLGPSGLERLDSTPEPGQVSTFPLVAAL
jgi:hypothetical protein